MFQPVFVGDVAAAIAKVLDTPSASGGAFELGGPCRYSFRQLLEYILEVTCRSRVMVPLPFAMASFAGFFLGMLPNPLLTVDQVQLLKNDNIVKGDDKSIGVLSDLGVEARSIEAIVPTYLERYRRHGQFEESRVG
jgi:NADH dehydrogenase